MTQDELADLIDLSVDGALPEALRAHVEAYLADNPEAAQLAAGLQSAVSRLQAAPRNQPAAWFVERTLDRLLREHAAAQDTETTLSKTAFSRRK